MLEYLEKLKKEDMNALIKKREHQKTIWRMLQDQMSVSFCSSFFFFVYIVSHKLPLSR